MPISRPKRRDLGQGRGPGLIDLALFALTQVVMDGSIWSMGGCRMGGKRTSGFLTRGNCFILVGECHAWRELASTELASTELGPPELVERVEWVEFVERVVAPLEMTGPSPRHQM